MRKNLCVRSHVTICRSVAYPISTAVHGAYQALASRFAAVANLPSTGANIAKGNKFQKRRNLNCLIWNL